MAAGKGKNSRRSKGGKKGLTAKRHEVKGERPSLTMGGIKRLARRAGVKRISAAILDETRDFLDVFLERILTDSLTYCGYAKKKTITAQHVVYALKRQGRTIYGYGF